ncbi:MAG: hypothetical protein HY054_02730 [Proteobacteria bacterium]|nr:hypothetical protein [Pseudomonadota bacterium]
MSAVPISLEIDGVRHGWASMSLRAGDETYRMQGFSYTTDAFDDFVRFGVNVALHSWHSEIVFDGEPAGWLWTFEADNAGPRSWLSVYEMADASHPDGERQKVLWVEVQADQLAQAVLDAMKRLKDSLGVQEFEKAWMQPFPARGLTALAAALEDSNA